MEEDLEFAEATEGVYKLFLYEGQAPTLDSGGQRDGEEKEPVEYEIGPKEEVA